MRQASGPASKNTKIRQQPRCGRHGRYTATKSAIRARASFADSVSTGMRDYDQKKQQKNKELVFGRSISNLLFPHNRPDKHRATNGRHKHHKQTQGGQKIVACAQLIRYGPDGSLKIRPSRKVYKIIATHTTQQANSRHRWCIRRRIVQQWPMDVCVFVIVVRARNMHTLSTAIASLCKASQTPLHTSAPSSNRRWHNCRDRRNCPLQTLHCESHRDFSIHECNYTHQQQQRLSHKTLQ